MNNKLKVIKSKREKIEDKIENYLEKKKFLSDNGENENIDELKVQVANLEQIVKDLLEFETISGEYTNSLLECRKLLSEKETNKM